MNCDKGASNFNTFFRIRKPIMKPQIKRANEFDLIARHFAPLAQNFPGALGLLDDAALINARAGSEFVITADTLVAGIHFREVDNPDVVASRLLGCNLSDLAASSEALKNSIYS